MIHTNYRFLIPLKIIDHCRINQELLETQVKQYMVGRYPNYSLLTVEDGYAICQYVEEGRGESEGGELFGSL